MTLKQFNSAVDIFCKAEGVEDTHDRFIATIGGKNILYTQLSEYTNNWDKAQEVGIGMTCNEYVFAEVENIPSQFEYERWNTPTIQGVEPGTIKPERVKGKENVVLYNKEFIAYSYAKPDSKQAIGFLEKQIDGNWEGFGESERQEYIQWLIKTGIIPV